MKILLPFSCLFLLFVWGCSQPEATIEPQPKVDLCQLTAVAQVEYYQIEHEGYASFFYLSLKNEEGIWLDDVYPIRLEQQYMEVGKKLRIQYFYLADETDQFIFPSACGAGGDDEITLESMKKIVICESKAGSI